MTKTGYEEALAGLLKFAMADPRAMKWGKKLGKLRNDLEVARINFRHGLAHPNEPPAPDPEPVPMAEEVFNTVTAPGAVNPAPEGNGFGSAKFWKTLFGGQQDDTPGFFHR